MFVLFCGVFGCDIGDASPQKGTFSAHVQKIDSLGQKPKIDPTDRCATGLKPKEARGSFCNTEPWFDQLPWFRGVESRAMPQSCAFCPSFGL